MPAGFRRFSAVSTAFPALLADCWKARSPLPTTYAYALSTTHSPYASIADAMLQRAARNYEPPPQMKEVTPSNATNPNEKSSKTSTPSSQSSLSGFLKSKHLNTFKQTNPPKLPSSGESWSSSGGSETRKRKSSELHGLAATLSKADSFENMPDAMKVTEKRDSSASSSSLSSFSYDIDPNDFEDDADLDLDVQYPLPLQEADTIREPLMSVSTNISQLNAHNATTDTSAAKSNIPQSSMPWSSSPLSHKLTPPGAANRRQLEQEPKIQPPPVSSEPSIDANPRPAKRRTVPWLEREHRQEAEDAVPTAIRLNHEEQSKVDATPSSKERTLPWNTTASAVKTQQRTFKVLKKKVTKDKENMSVDEMQHSIATSHASRPAPICLSDEQNEVLRLVTKQNKSVFFTGSAGTGKSVLMRSIIGELRKLHAKEPDRVAVTASTGLAACNIGGTTLHSYAGIGLGKESVDELRKKISRNQKAKNRWMRTKVLIIDEISMVDGDLFDKLEALARALRKNGRPFGGIQVVVTGDFFQLPPVPDYGTREAKFAFDAGSWSTVVHHTIRLTEVFRQRDPVFANMLNEMRLGNISDEMMKAFRKLERPIKHEDALEATELFPTRQEVDNANAFKMRSLQGKRYIFKAVDSGTVTDIERRNKLLQYCMAPPQLELKKGAQVMLIKNIDENLVNGSLGTVIAFMDEKKFEIYDEDPTMIDGEQSDEEKGARGFTDAKSKLNKMRNKDLVADTANLYPLVRFRIADGTSRDLLCQPEEWKVELPNGEVQAQRSQVPLILAWALSIHKAQGQTMSLVKVDLRKVFERGQAYVALSRATTQDGLCVLNFNKRAVMAHPRVAEFYNSLYSVSDALKKPKKTLTQPVMAMAVAQMTRNQDSKSVNRSEFDDEEEAMAAYG